MTNWAPMWRLFFARILRVKQAAPWRPDQFPQLRRRVPGRITRRFLGAHTIAYLTVTGPLWKLKSAPVNFHEPGSTTRSRRSRTGDRGPGKTRRGPRVSGQLDPAQCPSGRARARRGPARLRGSMGHVSRKHFEVLLNGFNCPINMLKFAYYRRP